MGRICRGRQRIPRGPGSRQITVITGQIKEEILIPAPQGTLRLKRTVFKTLEPQVEQMMEPICNHSSGEGQPWHPITMFHQSGVIRLAVSVLLPDHLAP